MNEHFKRIWDYIPEYIELQNELKKAEPFQFTKEDNMQNINGQWVDVDAIEKLRDHYDQELDASDWCDFDAETDESYELTMEIRKAQYDEMIDSIYTLKQKYTWASRHAKKLEEDKKDLIDEIHELKDFIDELQQYIIGQEYMPGWFGYLEMNDDLTEYEQDGVLADHQLPFSYESLDKLYTIGITRPMLVEYTKKKYMEWKEKEKNGIQLDIEGSTEE